MQVTVEKGAFWRLIGVCCRCVKSRAVLAFSAPSAMTVSFNTLPMSSPQSKNKRLTGAMIELRQQGPKQRMVMRLKMF
ncbi:hypothetical protein PQR02_39900 [Paraburkholderia sediminicola]|uniref:Uncharacterized protein n=1 Tax=Paraburkholderia rhynchosiae TaxID=487049 RepID=A0ACC7NPM7_9BURK